MLYSSGAEVKYDAVGTKLWTRHALDGLRDPSGGVFVAGTTTTGLDGYMIPSRREGFVMKYLPDGNIAGASSPVGIEGGNAL